MSGRRIGVLSARGIIFAGTTYWWDRKVINFSEGKTKARLVMLASPPTPKTCFARECEHRSRNGYFLQHVAEFEAGNGATEPTGNHSQVKSKNDSHFHSAFRKARAVAKVPSNLVLYSTRHT
jgi:hypothetical protein